MVDRPILFSTPMVQALLAGRKSQTRRVIEPYEAVLHPNPLKGNRAVPRNLIRLRLPASGGGFVAGPCFKLPYAVGDRLWVREVWRPHGLDTPLSECSGPEDIMYRADADEAVLDWKPSIFMPRWASRLTLVVTTVRVQRLQEISEADALAEGAAAVGADPLCPSYVWAFHTLWEHLHGRGSWMHNPWVVALTFSPHHCNIDQLRAGE